MKQGIRVIVCGGRDYGEVPSGLQGEQLGAAFYKAAAERHHLRASLDKIAEERGGFAVVFSGGALGADRHARGWAIDRFIEARVCYANWSKYGPKAGPIRNTVMLKTATPQLVIGFPGGDGTADMLRKARAAGVEVVEIGDPG